MENCMTTNKLKRKLTAFVLSLTMAAGMHVRRWGF